VVGAEGDRRAALSAVLRKAFAGEVAQRLPRLEALTDPEAARRDAHTLGSSAYVVGEPEIARLARAVEADLEHGPRQELVALLRAWTP
jgi:HPt (histidine-containing phosphotransfer) domain-containing protein